MNATNIGLAIVVLIAVALLGGAGGLWVYDRATGRHKQDDPEKR